MKPGDFYVGVLEFFAILLPGSILLGYLVSQPFFAPALGLFPLNTEVERYSGFLLAAYTLGHIVFLLASMLDERVHDPLREMYGKDEAGDAYDLASKLRQRHIGGDDGKPMNTFKWAQAYLLQNAPAAAAEVRRYEADSKFFRSLTLLMAIMAVLFLVQENPLWAAFAVGFCLACYWRYAEQRTKCTNVACRHVIVLCNENPFKPAAPGKSAESSEE